MKNNDFTLLIMAAGMGSRFGGLKQIEPFGPNGEFIVDYSIKDAIRAGFNKVVFVIKKENLEIFKDSIGKRIEKHIKVEYAFQELEDLPEGFIAPKKRVKPWGTGQAILAAKNNIKEPFAIINADDFYGYDSYKNIINYLKNIPLNDKQQYALIGYLMRETLSENGSVKRGICNIKNGKLINLVEANIVLENNKIIANPLDSSLFYELEENTLASMNMFGFEPSIFDFLEQEFKLFLTDHINEPTSEFLIPKILSKGVKTSFCDLNIVNTSAKWYGVTYKEDIISLKTVIEEKINNKEYTKKLWN